MASAFQSAPQPQPDHSAKAAAAKREAEQAAVKRAGEQRRRAQEEARRREARLAADAAARRAAAVQAEKERRRLEAEDARQMLVERHKHEMLSVLEETLKGMGYLPPAPSPLLQVRAVAQLREAVLPNASETALAHALLQVESDVQKHFNTSLAFVHGLKAAIASKASVVDRFKMFMARVDGVIERATFSLDAPPAAAALREAMERNERFLAEPWTSEAHRGVLAIHIDEESRQTILQIGLAEHGVVYITIPRILKPQDLAHSSLGELLGRMKTFTGTVDPLAIINGAYPKINFTYLFERSRVLRAPSGDVTRLQANLAHVSQRPRLAPQNTTVINSAPATAAEYACVFPDNRRGWATWSNEATQWQAAAADHGFTQVREASREAFLTALAESQNVIVMVAHCNGHDLFLPHPPPAGTRVSADDVHGHRDAIAANRPFVYMFACEAGNLDNVDNFASALLNAGASGVIAAQTTLGAAQGRDLLARILNEHRGAPPIEDFWRAIRETGHFEMEVFLG